MQGGGPYEVSDCPKCGNIMWNGQCENRDCEYHWYPLDKDEEEEEYLSYRQLHTMEIACQRRSV